MIRIAAVGDLHYGRQPIPRMREHFGALGERADLLLVAGDLTQSGDLEEARLLCEDLRACNVPVALVLGNHDYHLGQDKRISELLCAEGYMALEGQSACFEIGGWAVGVVGLKGFGGGFVGASVTDFGEPEMKAFAHQVKSQAEVLRRELSAMEADFRFVLLHYSPIEATLLGERREVFPFMGSYLLSEVIDSLGADCVFHGHAHLGCERGATPRGIPVRNVAQPVIRTAYRIYHFEQPRAASPISISVGNRATLAGK